MRDQDTSIGALIGQLLAELAALIRAEIQLVKTEAEAKFSQVKRALVMFVVALVFVFAAIVSLTSAASAALQVAGLDPVFAHLATGVLALVVAGLLGWLAASWLKPKALKPTKTITEFERNRAAAVDTLD